MKINSVEFSFKKLTEKMGKSSKVAFVTAFVVALISHMSILLSDVPNHDGLASIYFDQNMITSGRWFLEISAGISSFYSLPWLIGILSIFYLSLTAAVVVNIFDINNSLFAALCAAVLVTFPTLAGNFAYVFTMDGYMLGLLLCVLSVYMVKPSKNPGKFSWVIGAVLLGFGMGTYQAYLSVAILLCFFLAVNVLLEENKALDKAKNILRFVLMGAGGLVVYYVMLRVLLLIQGKELATYQGINGMTSANKTGILSTVKLMYADFLNFTLKSKVVVPNAFSAVSFFVILLLAIVLLAIKAYQRGYFKKVLFYVFTLVLAVLIPCLTNAILLISSDVTYHVLMRYQWVIFIVFALSVISKSVSLEEGNLSNIICWVTLVCTVVLSFTYLVTDNIAYSNLNKKYEKTYAYCVRLADRIEQTPGYYQGIPIAMVGVVGQDNFPTTDITGDVTGGLIGVSGDYLLYKGENYADFFKHYLGITINVLPEDYVVEFYDSPLYASMASFPDAGSTVVSDGILYIKTENVR